MKLPEALRNKIKKITLDIAGSMQQIVKKCFINTIQVVDRFHVQKLVGEALQNVRIKYLWEELDKEHEAIALAKQYKQAYVSEVLNNGDTKKQLLARSRHLLYKSPN